MLLRDDLARTLAAAVHMGWISVQEGVCDALDCMANPHIDPQQPKQVLHRLTMGKWLPAYVVHHYLDPTLPGDCRCKGNYS